MQNKQYILFIIVSFLCILFWTDAQEVKTDSTIVEEGNNLDDFREISEELAEIRSQAVISLEQLEVVKEEILIRKELIKSIKEEIKVLEVEILDNEEIIEALRTDIKSLKNEYAEMLYATSKQSLAYNRLLLIFSANSINQFYRRIKYVQQYAETRQIQVQKIKKVQKVLNRQVQKTENVIEKKQRLIKEKTSETYKLASLVSEKDILVASLSEQKDILELDLEIKQENLITLDKLILEYVSEEIEDRKNTPKNKQLTQSFARRKGGITWAVSGFIVRGFGKQKHPILKNVWIENNGVDIKTKETSFVRAAHEGKVLKIIKIPNMKGKVLMLQHGDYHTVYANVKNISVVKGEWVGRGKHLAQVYTEPDGSSQLQFQIWYQEQKLNPQKWLARRR